jgi:Ca2+/Na+ antiporter
MGAISLKFTHHSFLRTCCQIGILFVALAVLCDEWLVPHLEVVQKALRMSDDLAGVTLMAFGGAVRL